MACVNPSTALARVLVDELIACGVTDAVLAPGSRNAPLSMALYDADAIGRLRLHVRIDERTAGFLAVGLARGSGRPAVVVTTSGTAVANLHPAVLEAHHGGVPLLVLSADRPPWLRDVGANQAIDQQTLFGPALRFFHEFGVPQRGIGAERGVAGDGVPGGRGRPRRRGNRRTGAAESAAGRTVAARRRRRTRSAAGGLAGIAGRSRTAAWTTVVGSRRHVRACRSPLPGPASGCSSSPTSPIPGPRPLPTPASWWSPRPAARLVQSVMGAGVHLLAASAFLDEALPDRVIVLGRPTLFRQVQRLLADPRVTVDVIAHPRGYADPSGTARIVAAGWPDLRELPDAGWAAQWRAADRRACGAVRAVLDELDIAASPRLARDLVAALPGRATLVLGPRSPRGTSR